jgi:hypothetical protein
MGIKKVARPMNAAKNAFVKWLKDRDVEMLDVFEGTKESNDGWDYYRSVDGFIGDDFYLVVFGVWKGIERIEYKGGEYNYPNISISEFMDIL